FVYLSFTSVCVCACVSACACVSPCVCVSVCACVRACVRMRVWLSLLLLWVSHLKPLRHDRHFPPLLSVALHLLHGKGQDESGRLGWDESGLLSSLEEVHRLQLSQ